MSVTLVSISFYLSPLLSVHTLTHPYPPCRSTLAGLLIQKKSYHFFFCLSYLAVSPTTVLAKTRNQPSCSCPCDVIEMWTSKRSRLDLLLQLAKKQPCVRTRNIARGLAFPIRPSIRPFLMAYQLPQHCCTAVQNNAARAHRARQYTRASISLRGQLGISFFASEPDFVLHNNETFRRQPSGFAGKVSPS